jgi:hypothetical protein
MINAEQLIWTVYNCMEEEKSYSILRDPKHKSKLSQDDINYRWKNSMSASNQLCDLARILNTTTDKLVKISRLINRWEAKRNYQICFPITRHQQQIIRFLHA